MGQEEIQKAILDALKNIAANDGKEGSIQEIAKSNILRYLDEYHQIVAQLILKKEKSEHMDLIKGLVHIYPLSANILDDIFSNEYNNHEYSEEELSSISEWFDISEVMLGHFRRMITKIRKIDFSDINSELKDEIESYSDQRNEQLKEREELQQLREEKKSIINEIEKLRSEVESLKKETNDSELNIQKTKLQNEKNQLLKKNKDNTAEIKKLKTELEKIKKPDDNKFNEALKAFSKAMSALPDDEVC